MAEYKITYTPDGRIKKALTYKETIFSYAMIPDEYGKTGDKKGFEHQVRDKFPNEEDYVFDALDNLSFADDEEIEETLSLLTGQE